MPTIPTDVQPRSLARILVAPSFGGGAGPWEILPMRSPNRPGGYEFIDCDRVPLPGVGQAHFSAVYGIVDGIAVAAELTTGSIAGEPWNPDASTAGARDLIGYDVRIQTAPYAAPGEEPAWKTEWWGEVSLQEDRDWPGAPYLTTRKTATWTLHCCGLLPSFESVTNAETGDTETIPYPRIGQVVTTLRAAGQVKTINTPISRIYYRHDRQSTTWETSWPELDFR